MTEEEFWAALAPTPELTPPSYRLYYGEQGEPLFYSMEDLPGKYVIVDHSTYTNPPTHVRVVDGVLTVLKTTTVLKLQPSDTGTPCHIQNVSIIVDEAHPNKKWILK